MGSSDAGEEVRRIFERGFVALHAEQEADQKRHPGLAVFIALLPSDDGFDVLFEVRAKDLKRQPGEVCLPGGHVEPGEVPWRAAVRETCEELQVAPEQVHLLGALDPGAAPNERLQAFYGTIEGYKGTWLAEEVDRTFTVPLAWFMDNEPTIYSGWQDPTLDEGFPWHLIPRGRDYPFRRVPYEVCMYHGTDPLIWGLTARIMLRFTHILRLGRLG